MRKVLTRVGEYPSRPVAFVIWALYALPWFIFDLENLDSNAVATYGHLAHDPLHPTR
jgi:hypothetical protein